MPHRAAVVPHTAIKTVGEIFCLDQTVSSVKGCHDRQNLLLPDPRLVNELVVANAGVGFLNFYYPMQYELPVITAVQGKIKLFKLIRRG